MNMKIFTGILIIFLVFISGCADHRMRAAVVQDECITNYHNEVHSIDKGLPGRWVECEKDYRSDECILYTIQQMDMEITLQKEFLECKYRMGSDD